MKIFPMKMSKAPFSQCSPIVLMKNKTKFSPGFLCTCWPTPDCDLVIVIFCLSYFCFSQFAFFLFFGSKTRKMNKPRTGTKTNWWNLNASLAGCLFFPLNSFFPQCLFSPSCKIRNCDLRGKTSPCHVLSYLSSRLRNKSIDCDVSTTLENPAILKEFIFAFQKPKFVLINWMIAETQRWVMSY